MNIVQGRHYQGDKPEVAAWDGTGFHPILGLTMEQIRNRNASVPESPSVDSDVKQKAMDPEQEAAHMAAIAAERQQDAMIGIAKSLEAASRPMTNEVISVRYTE